MTKVIPSSDFALDLSSLCSNRMYLNNEDFLLFQDSQDGFDSFQSISTVSKDELKGGIIDLFEDQHCIMFIFKTKRKNIDLLLK